jgi:uncharacterized protein YdhG (YjbR/CyaY superfamily)
VSEPLSPVASPVPATPPETLERQQQVLQAVQAALPDARPCVGYGMPAFRLDRVFIYVGAFRRHVGVYPPVKGDAALQARLAPYRGPKGNLSFPLGQPLPLDLIVDVARALAIEVGARKTTAASPRSRA